MNTGLFDRAATDTKNNAGSTAHKYDAKHELAQVAATGTFSDTFYVSGKDQLETIIKLAGEVKDDKFLAKLALYAREKAYMKDMPCALLAIVSGRSPSLTRVIFPRIIDNGRTLRTFTQMIRSGKFGKKGFSACIKKLASEWLNNASIQALLNASIGEKPSLRDVLRLVRPKPKDDTRRAAFAYLVGKRGEFVGNALGFEPDQIVFLEQFRAAQTDEEQAAMVSNLYCRWDLLSSHAKGPKTWAAIAEKMNHQALRMNLNTLARHGVFSNNATIEWIANRLTDEERILGSKQLPYQLYTAYKFMDDSVPQKIRSAISKSVGIAMKNVPAFSGRVLVGVDTSGSMRSAVTGKQSVDSKMRYVDVAALFAASVVKKNPNTLVIPFDTQAYRGKFDADNSVTSIADLFASFGGCGTDCSLPLKAALKFHKNERIDAVIIISDNESWYGNKRFGRTNLQTFWQEFAGWQRTTHSCNPKLVCIDISPNGTTQAPNDKNVMNIGGFSDAIFGTIERFLSGETASFVKEIEAIDLINSKADLENYMR